MKNSIATYFAAIEIHNKPNISYRYETVTLLMMNAWELVLKTYINIYQCLPDIEIVNACVHNLTWTHFLQPFARVE